MRLVAASALRAASFGGRRLLSAPGTGGAFPPLPRFHPLCYNTTILDMGDACLTFGAWSMVMLPHPHNAVSVAAIISFFISLPSLPGGDAVVPAFGNIVNHAV